MNFLTAPSPLPGALSDELAIAAMVKALQRMPDYDLFDERLRILFYADSKIPRVKIYRLDHAALKTELIRRRVMRENRARGPSEKGSK